MNNDVGEFFEVAVVNPCWDDGSLSQFFLAYSTNAEEISECRLSSINKWKKKARMYPHNYLWMTMKWRWLIGTVHCDQQTDYNVVCSWLNEQTETLV